MIDCFDYDKIEELIDDIKFDDKGLVPTVAQDINTKDVIMLAYMNKESIIKTIKEKKACYYSRSRKELWVKGETSGNYQNVKGIYLDCDKDSILLLVEQLGVACHTGEYSCFHNLGLFCEEKEQIFQSNNQCMDMLELLQDKCKELSELSYDESSKLSGTSYDKGSDILEQLYELIKYRKNNPIEGSYTNYLFQKGLDKILKKVGEETSEVIIGAKNKDKNELVYEISDLVYHLLVLMVNENISIEDIKEELKSRKK